MTQEWSSSYGEKLEILLLKKKKVFLDFTHKKKQLN